MKERIKMILIVLSIPLIGYLSSFTFEPIGFYDSLVKPTLAPTPIVFPIAWSILYTLLGVFLYNIIRSKDIKSIVIYVTQMTINFLWSIVFFNLEIFSLSLIMIGIMFILSVILFVLSNKEKFKYVLVPYLLWLCFAFYLNLSIIILN